MADLCQTCGMILAEGEPFLTLSAEDLSKRAHVQIITCVGLLRKKLEEQENLSVRVLELLLRARVHLIQQEAGNRPYRLIEEITEIKEKIEPKRESCLPT